MEKLIRFNTKKFNTTEVKAHFINEICFGEDLAKWLGEKLDKLGYMVTIPDQEDWGWYMHANKDEVKYFFCFGVASDETGRVADGEWVVAIEKKRSFWNKLLGKDQLSGNDEIIQEIINVLKGDTEISNIELSDE